MVGAPGIVGVMDTLCVTSVAMVKLASPAWFAPIVQVPAVSIVTVVPLTVQTDSVFEA